MSTHASRYRAPRVATRVCHDALPRIALLGTGAVGCAFVARYERLRAAGIPVPQVIWLSNSRVQLMCSGPLEDSLRHAQLASVPPAPVPPWMQDERLSRGDLLVDATNSEVVADWHSQWLSRGVHVVTANKLGVGADAGRADAIAHASLVGCAHYGDSATVGAGLPLLRSIRNLVAGGDRIHAVEGVLSGSLAWLFDRYDGIRPFSSLVREAQQAGYTEPDPRMDLSGEDVRRKLLILSRAAGFQREAHAVQVDSIVPPALAAVSALEVDAHLDLLNLPLCALYQRAQRDGAKLRFIGRFDAQSASAGLRMLPGEHALCSGHGTDNRVAIYSDRYQRQPLVVQGPGAGADVTGAALLDDVLSITHAMPSACLARRPSL